MNNSHLHHLDWKEILKSIEGFATSGTGKMSIAKTNGFEQANEAKQMMEHIFDAQALIQTGVRPFMESLDFFEPWFLRIKKKSVLTTLEMKDVRHFCHEVLALRESLLDVPNNWSKNLFAQLMNADEPLSAIDQVLTPRGDIRMDASEKLFQLSKEKETLAKFIHQSLEKLVNDHQMNNLLQDKFVTTRDGRWVVPVKSGMQHYLAGVIHGSSQTKQTVFIEPQTIIPNNNRLRQIEVEIEDEVERLLTELSHYLHGLHSLFQKSREQMEATDILLAKSQFSLAVNAQAFEFSEDEILLKNVKHPLMIFQNKNVVGNTVQLQKSKSILLLSGPNAGGKTVLMKSIGLAIQMALCGLPICADVNSKLPFFKNILVGIGDSQNVSEELSTFAAHLKILEHAMELRGFNSIVFIDEICGSTDPEEGSALARSCIEVFAKNQIFAVMTSHFTPLKIGWSQESPVLNGSLEYDRGSGRPTYHYIPGVPGDSLAIQTAKRVGFPQEILDRAVELLSPTSKARLNQMYEIEQIKTDMNLLRSQYLDDQKKAKAEKQKYEALAQALEKDKENILQKLQKSTEKKIDEMISLARAENTFKKHLTLQDIKTQLPEIIKSKPGISGAPTTPEEFAQKYPPGSKVFLSNLNQDGIVQSSPNGKGEVFILSGSIRMNIHFSELKPPMQAQNPTSALVRRSSNVTIALQDNDRILDLRGETAEEAISQLEISLDQAASQKESRVKIIHGHGTEVLKKAVRTYLSRSVYVKKWKSGSNEQGGDGVTFAELLND